MACEDSSVYRSTVATVMRTCAPMLAAALVAAPAAGAQENPVTWTLTPSATTVAPGGTVSAKLSATIEDGWHVYSITQGPGGPIPTRISLADGHPFVLADALKAPAPISGFDSNFGITVETYEGSAAFTLPLKVAATAHPGVDTLAVRARYQVCNASLCLPAKTETVTAPITISAAGAAKKAGHTAS